MVGFSSANPLSSLKRSHLAEGFASSWSIIDVYKRQVQQVANLEKKVPLDWISPDGMQVTAAFEEYARPLILDEVTPVYVNGTPRHIRL